MLYQVFRHAVCTQSQPLCHRIAVTVGVVTELFSEDQNSFDMQSMLLFQLLLDCIQVILCYIGTLRQQKITMNFQHRTGRRITDKGIEILRIRTSRQHVYAKPILPGTIVVHKKE